MTSRLHHARSRPCACARSRSWARSRRSAGAVAVAGTLLGALPVLVGCGDTPAVGPSPGASAPVGSPSPTPSSSVPDAFTLDVFVDAKTVTPTGKQVDLVAGQTVVLVTHTDHDVTLKISGPAVDRSVLVARLTTIPTSFVARAPGTVTVSSSDPAAVIATLHVLPGAG